MSEELKRKLYNYEANPPEIVWSRLVTVLDDELIVEFPERLYTLEVAPPADAWSKIENGLEEHGQQQYPGKLYNLEVAPPPTTWSRILNSMGDEKSFTQPRSRGKIIPFVRYAAAACIIGILAFAAFRLLDHKSGNEPIAVKEVLPRKDSAAGGSGNQQLVAPLDNNLPKEAPTLARLETRTRKKNVPEPATYMTQMAANLSSTTGSRAISDFRQVSLKGDIPGNCSTISDADPYLMFVNPDGYLIRISKKLAETLGCVYTNGNSNEYDRCQDQIKKWRDKIAQSPATSSPDNFMDILNVIKSVQE